MNWHIDNDTSNKTYSYTVYKSEIEAMQIMMAWRGERTTEDSIKDDADYIINLADRIKRDRLRGASN